MRSLTFIPYSSCDQKYHLFSKSCYLEPERGVITKSSRNWWLTTLNNNRIEKNKLIKFLQRVAQRVTHTHTITTGIMIIAAHMILHKILIQITVEMIVMRWWARRVVTPPVITILQLFPKKLTAQKVWYLRW